MRRLSGLLGTVLGIMKAFRDLRKTSKPPATKRSMLGIAEALVSTAVGLVVAIPAVIAYNAFQKQVRQSLQSLESVRELCLAYAMKRRARINGGQSREAETTTHR